MSAFLQTVEKKFNEAKESKDLVSFETTATTKENNSVEVSFTVFFIVFEINRVIFSFNLL